MLSKLGKLAPLCPHVPTVVHAPGAGNIESWTEDPARREDGHIPEEVRFKTKPELALEMIQRAVADGLPPGLALADSAYGDSADFRRVLRCKGLDYDVGIHRTSTVWRLDSLGRRQGEPVAVGDLPSAIGRHGFRRVTWPVCRQRWKTVS